ncbi:MOSC domain-containing protein [Bacillus sp. CLL-7-23]|uniref:MOSC domain-containing protein n=1 Tax=Bacillus changyiensis TaxID=3004103 RepID=A0ABT4X0J1_9BACI|nr:MOSC domain-containing protein [Bacillus changyiensis]MDA7025199.1 MOSC domain-containing protein [Bacillus changyiensis]
MSMKIISINIGKPITIDVNGKEIQTGIYKMQIKKPIYLGKLNFQGDGQADLVHHGGVDKAVCVYPFEHYQYWENELNRKLEYGAFGENLTVTGMLETNIHIGDIFQIGEAIVQVTQPRQPCFKLAKRYDLKDFPIRMQNNGYTGFYFRVLEEGWVTPGSNINRLETNAKQVTIEFANQIMHHDKKNVDALKRILEVEQLSGNWTNTFRKRLKGTIENTQERIEGK